MSPVGLCDAGVLVRTGCRSEFSFIRLCVLIRGSGGHGGLRGGLGWRILRSDIEPSCGLPVIVESVALIPVPTWKLSFDALEAHNHARRG